MFNLKTLFSLFLFLFTYSTLQAQIKAHFRCLADSIILGKPIPFSFSIHYPVGYSIIFPDSSKDFSPYELHQKKYFPTFVHNHYAIDSVIYFITSFQIDSIQKFQLPFAYVYKFDTTLLKSDIIRVPFQRKVFHFTDNTPYLLDNQLIEIPIQPNYGLLLLLFLISILIAIFLAIFFRKTISKWLLLYKTQKEWLLFQTQLNKVFNYDDPKKLIYELNLLWKQYLGTHNAIKPESLTSKELCSWIDTLYFIENKQLFVELCKLEERIFYASESFDKSILLNQKAFILQELNKVYQFKKQLVTLK